MNFLDNIENITVADLFGKIHTFTDDQKAAAGAKILTNILDKILNHNKLSFHQKVDTAIIINRCLLCIAVDLNLDTTPLRNNVAIISTLVNSDDKT